MDKFEEYIKARYPVDYEHLKEKYPNVPVGEFYGDEKDLWNCKQAELDHLNEVLEERTKEWLEAIKLGTYFQDAAKPLKEEVEQLNKTLSIKSKFLEDSDVAHKFLSEQLEEKNKRIRNAVALLNEIHKRSLDNPEVWDLVDDVWEALRGNDQYKEHRTKAEQQINKGARLTKHQIDLGDKNANS